MLRMFIFIHTAFFVISNLFGQQFNSESVQNHSDTVYYDGTNQAWYIYIYSDTLLHGVQREFYSNGRIKRQQVFAQGKCSGIAVTYYESGQIKMLHELDEACDINGRVFTFYESGIMESTVEYSKGTGLLAHRMNGHWKVVSMIDEVNSFISGYYSVYFTNGMIKEEGNYCNYYYLEIISVEDGDDNEYVELRNIHPVKHGLWSYFDSDGNIIREELYENGNIINEIKY